MIDRLRRTMMKPINRKIASALDPLVTSGTMFLVQGAVLLSATKYEFAAYSLAYSYVVMGQAMLSALFGGPLVTLLGNLPDKVNRGSGLMEGAVLRFQLATSAVLSVIGAIAAALLGIKATIILLVALGMIGLSFRDALRSILVAKVDFTDALIVALRFALVTGLTLVTLFLLFHRIDANLGLGALAFGSLVTVGKRIVFGLATRTKLPEGVQKKLIRMAVWSLPGAIVVWLQNSFYLTLVAFNLSLSAAGEVSAARMIAMPLLITASGLLRLAQVQASIQLAQEGLDSAIGKARRSALLCLAAGAVVAGACLTGHYIVDNSWLPHAFPHLLELAGAWIAFAAATTARGFYSSLFQAMGRYREIFVLNIIVLPFVLAGVALGPLVMGLVGAVIPMAVGELLLLLLLSFRSKLHHAPYA